MKPRRVELDYIAPVRRAPWVGLAVLVVSLAVASYLLASYRDAKLELARLEAAAGLISPERRPARALTKERIEEEVKSAEAVVRELTLPWAAVIEAVERAATREVAVLQLQPDAHSRILRITAEARSREAMFGYLRRLDAAKELSDVHVVSHQVQLDDPQRPLQFAVQATLKDGR